VQEPALPLHTSTPVGVVAGDIANDLAPTAASNSAGVAREQALFCAITGRPAAPRRDTAADEAAWRGSTGAPPGSARVDRDYCGFSPILVSTSLSPHDSNQ